MILYADSEGPDQTARMRRLIWDFAVRAYTRRHVFALRDPYEIGLDLTYPALNLQ